jgi:hypothetical protein
MASGTFSSQDYFIGSDAAFAGQGSRQIRQVEPFDIFHRPAFIADEMMMRVQIRVIPGGLAVERKLAHEAGFNQGV